MMFVVVIASSEKEEKALITLAERGKNGLKGLKFLSKTELRKGTFRQSRKNSFGS